MGNYNGEDLECRTRFQASCKIDCESQKEAAFLFERMIKLVQHFFIPPTGMSSYEYVPVIQGGDPETPTLANNNDEEIRIVPSKNLDRPLSEQAIPYYYNSGSIADLRRCLEL